MSHTGAQPQSWLWRDAGYLEIYVLTLPESRLLSPTPMPLDTTKLVNYKPSGAGKSTSACPECQRLGGDKKGNHLVLFNSGAYGCAVDNTQEHSRAIWKLAGLGVSGEYDPDTMYIPTEEPPPEIPQTWPLSVLDRLIKDHSYWEGRGISAEIMGEFRGGVATTGYFDGRYVIPIFNPEQSLIVGFTGRLLKKEGLTEWEKKTKWQHKGVKSSWVWGGLDEIESSRRVILLESPGERLFLAMHGVRDTLCLFGTAMSQTVLGQIITLNPSQIIISTNRDEGKIMGGLKRFPGQEAAQKIRNSLTPFFDPEIIQVIHPQTGGKDWAESTAEEIHRVFGPQDSSAPAATEGFTQESLETSANCFDIDPDPDTLSFA